MGSRQLDQSADSPIRDAPLLADLTKTHYVQLDGLRGLAILLVMVYHFLLPHAGFHSNDSSLILRLGQIGWMGVDLFFVLSGFLITGILIEMRARAHYFKNFLARRFLRIWPLYYLNLLVLFVVLPLVLTNVPTQVEGMRDKQIWFWLYAGNWLFAKEGGFDQTSGGYLWSLAVEEQFYLVWPFVVYALSSRTLMVVSLVLLAVSLVSRILLASAGVATGSLYVMTFTHMDGLAVGSFLAVCLRSPELSARLMRLLPMLVVVALAGLVVVRIVDGDFFFWSRAMAIYGYTLIAILFGALTTYLLRGGKVMRLDRWFSSRFMAQTGKYSYALYMVHVPVASVVFPLTFRLFDTASIHYELKFAVFAIVSFLVSWLLAVASWNLFEKHILALKRHFV